MRIWRAPYKRIKVVAADGSMFEFAGMEPGEVLEFMARMRDASAGLDAATWTPDDHDGTTGHGRA